ncbi:MAG: ParB/RepB/Spo0J family partition protein [Deltaproteobacteria bacterium]|nr:ParB/RepB/Spo0J family partition protein [Deltaproteobacteria bacterium]
MSSHTPDLPVVEVVEIERIRIPVTRLRSLGELDAMRESIATIGLMQPITVDTTYTLVSGRHRLEACRQLGWSHIPALIREVVGPMARLAEVDENLCRRELSVLERAEHIAVRKRLWIELNPAPLKGAPKTRKTSGEDASPDVDAAVFRRVEPQLSAFVGDTALRTGRAKAAVREDLKIGGLPEDVRDSLRDTMLVDNKRELLALTRMSDDEQREAVEKVKSGESKSVRKPKKKAEPALDEPVMTADDDELVSTAPKGKDGFEAWSVPSRSDTDRTRDEIHDAVKNALKFMERARSLWPDEEGSDEGQAKLHVAHEAVEALEQWLGERKVALPWAESA